MMKLFSDDKGKGDVVIILDNKEGRALYAALMQAIQPPKDGKKISKQSQAYKVAFTITEELSIW
ncbi:hypothetical protein [Rhizobium sp. PAMB 3182]